MDHYSLVYKLQMNVNFNREVVKGFLCKAWPLNSSWLFLRALARPGLQYFRLAPPLSGAFVDVCCETGVLARKKVGRVRLTDSNECKNFKTDRAKRKKKKQK